MPFYSSTQLVTAVCLLLAAAEAGPNLRASSVSLTSLTNGNSNTYTIANVDKLDATDSRTITARIFDGATGNTGDSCGDSGGSDFTTSPAIGQGTLNTIKSRLFDAPSANSEDSSGTHGTTEVLIDPKIGGKSAPTVPIPTTIVPIVQRIFDGVSGNTGGGSSGNHGNSRYNANPAILSNQAGPNLRALVRPVGGNSNTYTIADVTPVGGNSNTYTIADVDKLDATDSRTITARIFDGATGNTGESTGNSGNSEFIQDPKLGKDPIPALPIAARIFDGATGNTGESTGNSGNTEVLLTPKLGEGAAGKIPALPVAARIFDGVSGNTGGGSSGNHGNSRYNANPAIL